MKHFIGFMMSFGLLILIMGCGVYGAIKKRIKIFGIKETIIDFLIPIIFIGTIALGYYLLIT